MCEYQSVMGRIRDRKCHYGLEMRERRGYKSESATHDASKRRAKPKSALITGKRRQNASPFFLCYIIAIAMGIRFLVMVGIWAAVFINSFVTQEKTSIPSLENHCGPCPKHWICYRNSCYQFSNERKDWYQSKASCESQNSSLLRIYSREQQDFLRLVKSYHWMGLVQMPKNRSWHWEDGSVLLPDQISMVDMRNGSCAVYASSFKGYTESCLTPNTYICMQRPA